MNANTNATSKIQAETPQAVLAGAILKAAAKAPYQAPSIVSFSIDALSIGGPLALAGNTFT